MYDPSLSIPTTLCQDELSGSHSESRNADYKSACCRTAVCVSLPIQATKPRHHLRRCGNQRLMWRRSHPISQGAYKDAPLDQSWHQAPDLARVSIGRGGGRCNLRRVGGRDGRGAPQALLSAQHHKHARVTDHQLDVVAAAGVGGPAAEGTARSVQAHIAVIL